MGVVLGGLALVSFMVCWACLALLTPRDALAGLGWARAQRGMSAAAFALVAAALALRGWSSISGAEVSQLVGVSLSSKPTSDEITSAWGRLSIGFAMVGVTSAAIAGLLARSLVPMSFGARWAPDAAAMVAAAVFGVGICAIVIAQPKAWLACVGWVDVAAVLPLLGLALSAALGTTPRIEGAVLPDGARAAAPDRGRTVSDPTALLRANGVIGHPRQTWDASPGGCAADGIWSAVGGGGSSPRTLDRYIELAHDRQSVRIPDLPGDTEDALIAALVIRWTTGEGGRILVVHQRPRALQDRLTRAFERLGWGAPGPIIAGRRELTNALAARRVPAAIIANVELLSDAVIPRLAADGRGFLEQCHFFVVCRGDQLDPVRASHLHFACARLSLLTPHSDHQRAVFATAPGASAPSRRLDRMLGIQPTAVPLAPEHRRKVTLYDGLNTGGGAASAIKAAVRRAHELLVAAGIDVSVEDAAELLSSDDLTTRGETTALDPAGTLRGRVCLVIGSDEELSSIYRVAGNSAGPLDTEQIIVWWNEPSPLTNFLLEGDRLQDQARQAILPSPAPVYSERNTFLHDLHLRLAIHEGEPPKVELLRYFSARQLDHLFDKGECREGRVVSVADHEQGTVARSPLIALTNFDAKGLDARMTVTKMATAIIDGTSGEEIDRVDHRTVRTHYYPYKIFSRAGRRYRVPPGGGLGKPAELVVEAVDAVHDPTSPVVSFEINRLETLEGPHRQQQGSFAVRARTDEVMLTEVVSGATSRTGTIEFEPVSSEYKTHIRVVYLEHLYGHANIEASLLHLARVLDDVLLTHLRIRDEYLEVEPAPSGYGGEPIPALLFIDRHVGGIGVADALGLETLFDLFRWTSVLMKSCPCNDGCDRCSPPEVLVYKAKQMAIQMLES